MKKEWLESYEQEEREAVRRLGRECLIGSFEVKRMYSDKVSFKETYAHEMGVPVTLLLPFYDQVVTKLAVPRTPKVFEEGFGMSVEAVASLYKRRRLIPVLTWPTHYANLDYLDPLLELKPPTIARSNALVQLILIKRGHDPLEAMEFRKEAERRIIGRFGQLAERFQQGGIGLDQLYIESSLVNNHVELKCLGFDQIADRILSLTDPLGIYVNSFTYAMALAMPIVEGAGGWTQMGENRFADRTGLNLSRDIIFPVDVGTLLTKEYRLDSLLSADGTTLDRLYADSAISKARNLLSELSVAIRTSDSDKFADKKNQIEEVFTDARAAVATIDRIQNLSCVLAIGAIGWFVTGIPAALTTGLLPYVLKELGMKVASDAIDKATGFVSEPLLKLGFGPLPMSIWKFEKEWSGIISKRPPQP
ncbi:MAG: hypothetical protein ABSE39_10900 [Candidatus Bathyarchaeia archaeon]